MAADAAPLRIVTDSMSSGLMSDARLGDAVLASMLPVALVELSTGVPSTTKSGCPVPVIVLEPRMRIDADAPGSPDADVTSTFGAFAASAFTTFDSFARAISVPLTVFTALPSFSTVVTVPAPVTTISPRRSGLAARVKSCVIAPANANVTCADRCPSARAVRVTRCPCARAGATVTV